MNHPEDFSSYEDKADLGPSVSAFLGPVSRWKRCLHRSRPKFGTPLVPLPGLPIGPHFGSLVIDPEMHG